MYFHRGDSVLLTRRIPETSEKGIELVCARYEGGWELGDTVEPGCTYGEQLPLNGGGLHSAG